MVPPGLEPHVYITNNQVFMKTNGTRWIPTENVTAFTLSHPPPGYSTVWAQTKDLFKKS